MPSFGISTTLLVTVAIVLLLASPAHAFGAGNIASVAKIEGVNWRHGDIEDTLLTLVMSRAAGGRKFDKMNVARVYFGNWLRDYSQAIDVGTVKYVSAEAIRILLWVLGFMTFGFGTKEFEVTTARLGCYRPEDHIDNPKDYADNIDATQYDRRLRGPVNERVELAIDPNTGLKNYIANERIGIMTSAKHVRSLFTESIRLGRSYARSNNKNELYEALRLLGTGLHCLEDYSAHSNYTELALIEMGERDVFPHVGRQTKIRLQGAREEVYPVITGTFGGVDFLHSVLGEFGDKATQSEIQELEGTMETDSRADTSILKDLLDKIPSGIFGGQDESGKADELQQNAVTAQMNQTRVSPREPEEFTRHMDEVVKQIYPIIQYHDEIMLSITEAIESIPILPDLIEQFEEELNKFVFSLLAPFVLPIINQIKTELNTGSSEIIQSSKDKQLIVFNDDRCSDPTHSMLSKDHFSNILNEPAGKIASQVLKWVVPQLIAAWDDTSIDVDRTINRIVSGVFHHPAQRTQGDDGASDGRRLMFAVVEKWWGEQDRNYQQQLRQKLSRNGVMNGENHKEGVHDSGHGCGKPLGMNKTGGKGAGGATGALLGGLSAALGEQMGGSSATYGGGSAHNQQIGKFAEQAVGGGALGGIVGALAGGLGGGLLSGAFGGEDKKTSTSQGYTSGGGYQSAYTEEAHSGNKYGQAQYSETQYPGGRQETDYKRYEQSGNHGTGYEQRTETIPTYGGGYEQRKERIYEQDGSVETESWREGRTSDGRRFSGEHHKERRHSGRKSNDSNEGGYSGYGHKEKKHHNKKNDSDSDGDEGKRNEYGHHESSGYEQKKNKNHHSNQEYDSGGRPERGGNDYGGGREDGGYGSHQRNEYAEPPRENFGGYNQSEYGRQEYGRGREEHFGGGGGREEGGFGGEREERGSFRRGQEEDSRQGGGFGEGFGGEREGREGGGFGGGFGGDEGPGGFVQDVAEELFGGRDEERGEEYGEERRGGW